MRPVLFVAFLCIRSSQSLYPDLHARTTTTSIQLDPKNGSGAGDVDETIVFLHNNYDERSRVKVVGSWSNWTALQPMCYAGNRCWAINIHLTPGLHEFRFVVDGRWEVSIAHPSKVSYARQGEFGSGCALSYRPAKFVASIATSFQKEATTWLSPTSLHSLQACRPQR
eukprot:766346-Hanusia_phi.AAC.3